MIKRSLAEGSVSYHSQAAIYHRFAECEDQPGHIAAFLGPKVRNREVLDCGCGSGKYLRLLGPLASRYVGVDISREMLDLASDSMPSDGNIELVHSSAEAMPMASSSFDFVLASWVLGTILDPARRLAAIGEIMRVLKPNGRVLLVENDLGGEFEEIRDRSPQIGRTLAYNNWLLENGFEPIQRFQTFFRFDCREEARHIFGSIWGEEHGRRVRSALVEHKVVIFERRKPKEWH